jgi:HEAT repeat protein
MTDEEMRDMLVDYMGRGFLENIIALLRQEPELCRFIPDMLGSDTIRVRLGATALIEELAREQQPGLKAAVPGIIGLLKHENPTIRGDAASALGIIRDRDAADALREAVRDEHPGVREAAQDALADMGA